MRSWWAVLSLVLLTWSSPLFVSCEAPSAPDLLPLPLEVTDEEYDVLSALVEVLISGADSGYAHIGSQPLVVEDSTFGAQCPNYSEITPLDIPPLECELATWRQWQDVFPLYLTSLVEINAHPSKLSENEFANPEQVCLIGNDEYFENSCVDEARVVYDFSRVGFSADRDTALVAYQAYAYHPLDGARMLLFVKRDSIWDFHTALGPDHTTSRRDTTTSGY